ncbi:MAG TPA: ABC transporter permease [Gammaproteobacteria bacterium]|nr:ABC transporter permease [Gammaproteobacteria bacterium]
MKFSWARLLAVIFKEFIQIKRDRPTLGMMVGIPVIQVLLFGFAINTNPKHLPTALLDLDQSYYTRSFLQAMKNTDYFQFSHLVRSEREAEALLGLGKVLFVVNIPAHFTRDMLNDQTPQILVEADATDPVATGSAVSVLQKLGNEVFNQDLVGLVDKSKEKTNPFELVIHHKYNPDAQTALNIVSALLGVVLTMTLVIITGISITRENERGTMENLLSLPVLPLEVMIGKILPYILIGLLQLGLLLAIAQGFFHIYVMNKIIQILYASIPFIFANLAVGLTFSTLAKNQLQAVQLSIFFFLPSLLLSGFMFPFYGMPNWAQWIGNVLPLTHFVVAVRGILLKDFSFLLINQAILPICVFALFALMIGLTRFRRTLD